MRGTLDPVTQAKIETFARRRRRLILVRGLCAVLTILLAAMTVVALVDWQILLPDEVRWALSGTAYGLALLAAWFTCMRLVLRSPDPRTLARFIEQVRPELREDLISAVELGDPRGRERWDSEEFREILQKSVADRIRSVEVEALLSYRRIARWTWAAGAVTGLCLLLFLLPGLRYRHLLLRSLLPMANLERISRVQVAILAPDPPEGVVPQGDGVAVRVETSGPETKSVFLETFPAGKKPERVEMRPLGNRRYESAVVVGREPVAYRVRAGDAITRKYSLTPVPRPEAISFRKTFRYPAYLERRPETLSDARGDLEALEGTEVDLEIEVNQEVKAAELRIEHAARTGPVPLVPGAGPRRVRATVSVTAPATYRVHFVSSGTGFENRFSPQYEIRPRADELPRIALEDPTQDQIVPPDEEVVLRGTAKDDYGLRRVTQAVRINQGEWKEIVLAENAGLQHAVLRRWDLYELGVQPGDRVTTKLVAVDLKGNRAESAPLNVVVTAPGFDPNRLVPLALKEAVYEALVELHDAARVLEKRVSEAAKLAPGDELARKQALLNALADSERVIQEADAVEDRAKDAARQARAGREADDLVLVARLARRLCEDSIQAARAEIEREGGLALAKGLVGRAAEQAAGAEESFREILAGEEAVAVLNDLRDVARDQGAIHRQALAALAAGDPKAWERLSRRQGVAASQIKSVEDVLQVLVLRAGEGRSKQATEFRRHLEAHRTALEKLLAQPASASLRGPSEAMGREVRNVARGFHSLEAELSRRAEKARETLARRSDPSFWDVEAARRQMEAAMALQSGGKPHQGETDRAAARGKAARVQLEARAEVEEARRDSDPFFVSDSGLAGRALQAVLDAHAAVPEPGQTRELLSIVERAFRTLETGHGLAELSIALREAAEGERWAVGSGNLVTRHPKDWHWMEGRARALEGGFEEAGLPPEAARDLLKGWRGSAGDAVRAEMAQRIAFDRKPAAVAVPLEKLGGEVGRAVGQIQPALEAARRELQKLVPGLPERLARLAKAAERLREKTAGLSDRVPQSEPSQIRPEARNLLENQQAVDRQIDDIMTDLRRDANTQNLFTEEGRERARDADDAIAMLQQAPPKAEELLAQAASTPQAKAQAHALDRASEQQGKLAEALKTLAEHYKNLQARKPEETRPELRKAEEALGLKAKLDAQYAQMAKLAELAQQQNPEALRKQLESAAQASEEIRRELQQLAQNALDRAEAALQQAEMREDRAARAAQEAQQSARQTASIPEQARKIAEEARRMASKDVPAAAQQSKNPGLQKPFESARQNLNEGAQAVPQEFSKPPEAAKGLDLAAAELQQAAKDLEQATQGAREAAQKEEREAQAAQQAAQAAQQTSQAAQKSAQQAGEAAQKSAKQQAPAEQAKEAARAAQQSAQAAQQASQSAQQSAGQQPRNAAVQEAAKAAQTAAAAAQRRSDRAAQHAKEAAQQQGEAQKESVQAAQQAADGAAQAAMEAAQAAAQAAAPLRGAAQAEQAQAQSAQSVQQQSAQAAQRAGQLAQQARDLAGMLRSGAQAQKGQMAEAAESARQAAQDVQEAHSSLEQAARNEAAAGNPEQAESVRQVARGVEGVAQREVPAAQQATQGQNPAAAQQAAQAAQRAIHEQAQALAQARATQQGHPQQGQTSQGQPGALSEGAAQFMAQALNALNGDQQGAPQAMQSAAQAQAQSMSQERSQQGQGQPGQGQSQAPGQAPGNLPFSRSPGTGRSGAKVESGALGSGELPGNVMLRPGEWGKLPPRLARDLMEAQRENVGGEYREMVNRYFEAIAERAREKK
jgi:hypothetical protein